MVSPLATSPRRTANGYGESFVSGVVRDAAISLTADLGVVPS